MPLPAKRFTVCWSSLELIVDFGRDVALNDMQLKTIQDVLTQMGMGPVILLAEPIYDAS